jgi:hypothetical protein
VISDEKEDGSKLNCSPLVTCHSSLKVCFTRETGMHEGFPVTTSVGIYNNLQLQVELN